MVSSPLATASRMRCPWDTRTPADSCINDVTSSATTTDRMVDITALTMIARERYFNGMNKNL